MVVKNLNFRKGGREGRSQTDFDILFSNTDYIDVIYKEGGFSYNFSIYFGEDPTISTATNSVSGTTTPDLVAVISGVAIPYVIQPLNGYYVPTTSSGFGLMAEIEPIPPLDLLATLIGVTGLNLNANIASIDPIDLLATITGLAFDQLSGNIIGWDDTSISGLYHPYYTDSFKALLSGTGLGTDDLLAGIQGFVGVEEEDQLRAIILGSGHLNLDATIAGYEPLDITAEIEGYEPVGLIGSLLGLSTAPLYGSISGKLPDGSLVAEIVPTGDLKGLTGYIFASTEDTTLLYALVDGVQTQDLRATIGVVPQKLLNATITPYGDITKQLDLDASVSPNVSSDLKAFYDFKDSKSLSSLITAIEPGRLFATIYPKVFYVDSSIPISTFPYRDFKALINASACEFSSSFNDLHVSIKGVNNKDIEASVVGIAGQYAIAEDLIKFYVKNQVISEDWVFFIADQPATSEAVIPLVITNSPFGDLFAFIEGIQPSTDLSAEITPLYYSSVKKDISLLGEWVNTETGERKTLRIFFKGDALEYYYSEEAGTSLSLSPDSRLEIIVESFDKIDEDIASVLTQKTNVKRCVIDNLEDFESVDEAIKFGIMCAVSEISQNLFATITSKGDLDDLGAEVLPIDSRYIKDLKTKILPVANQPILNASIEGTGDLQDLNAHLISNYTDYTKHTLVDTLGIEYIPKVVVLENGQKTVVLTKVISTDIIVDTETPDLVATISGVEIADLASTISGTV